MLLTVAVPRWMMPGSNSCFTESVPGLPVSGTSCLSVSVSVPCLLLPGTSNLSVSACGLHVSGSGCLSVSVSVPCLLERGSNWSMTIPLLASFVMEKRQGG